jgi:hypothetical protein
MASSIFGLGCVQLGAALREAPRAVQTMCSTQVYIVGNSRTEEFPGATRITHCSRPIGTRNNRVVSVTVNGGPRSGKGARFLILSQSNRNQGRGRQSGVTS